MLKPFAKMHVNILIRTSIFDFHLKNMSSHQKVIVVTGCTKGIGRAICNHFAANGFSIAGYARSAADVEEMQNTFRKQYPQQQFHLTTTDASSKKDVLDFALFVQSKFSQVDVLVNNAGVFIPGNICEEPEGQLEQMMNLNLYSAYAITRIIAPTMKPLKKGHIFNMCSVASLKAYPMGGSYSISKYALEGFSKNLRAEMMPYGIKVTTINPGATMSDSWKGSGISPERIMEADDIAAVIWNAYQLSPQAVVEEIVLRPLLGDL
jgi:short-subunit dehydrogenase